MQDEQRLITYTAPAGAELNTKYSVKVRMRGDTKWIAIPCYKVKVDMHDIREASMAYFDFKGIVDVQISCHVPEIYQVDIRPLSKGIYAYIDKNSVSFQLNQPSNLSVEINKDRYHNLHLFAGEPGQFVSENNNKITIRGSMNRPVTIGGKHFLKELEAMPKGRTVFFEPGIYYIADCLMEIPSDTNIYLSGGAIIKGGFICDHAENIRFFGRGLIYQAGFERFHGINGVTVSYCRNISIEGISFINPPHYTISLGGSKGISIKNIKAFSCEGWSDGIDMMCCEDVHINDCFLRTSDDCIAIYGSRWDYNGLFCRNITIENSSLWADVAHPTNIGTHGDYKNNGNILENILFRNIDILEHHEYQANYLGCLAINVGDLNTARNIRYEDIRIESIEHGKVFDFQVKCNPDYNLKPGKGIENVTVKNVVYRGNNAVPSSIRGYGKDNMVRNIHFENLYMGGKKILSIKDEHLDIGDYAENIVFV